MTEKSIYTKKLGRMIAMAARTRTVGKYHVMTGLSHKWMVVPDGKVRPIKGFATQRAAVNFAKKTASKINGMVVVHDKTGEPRDTISYAIA